MVQDKKLGEMESVAKNKKKKPSWINIFLPWHAAYPTGLTYIKCCLVRIEPELGVTECRSHCKTNPSWRCAQLWESNDAPFPQAL